MLKICLSFGSYDKPVASSCSPLTAVHGITRFYVSILCLNNLCSMLLPATEMAGKRGEDALSVLVKRHTPGPSL